MPTALDGRGVFKSYLTTQIPRLALVLIGVVCFGSNVICCKSKPTENPESAVVKLRNELRNLAIGGVEQVEGHTAPEHSYVLLFGYMGPVESLPVSPELHKQLEALTPRDYERYVLVEVVGETITEYTEWSPRDDPTFRPMPLIIRGDPFRITAVERKYKYVVVTIE